MTWQLWSRRQPNDVTAKRRRGAVIAALAVVVGSVTIATPLDVVLAAPGDAQPLLTTKTGSPATAAAGEIISYAINYTCSNDSPTPPVDGCDGAVFSDPLPKFTDIYGNLVPVEFVNASGPASVWPTGFSVDNSDPANPRVVGTAGTWAPGSSGAIFINVRVPLGVVPVESQSLDNIATVTDPDDNSTDDSTTASTLIAATPPQWTVSKLGPSTTRMNRDVTWTISVCGPTTSALYPYYTITDTLPAGVQFVAASNAGLYADDAAPADVTSDGAGIVTWTFDSTNRPPLGADGCFRIAVTGRFPAGYVDPVSSDPANDDNVGGAQKTDTATGVGRDLPGDPGVDIGTADWTTGLIGAAFGIGDGGTTKSFSDLAGADNFYTIVGDVGVFNLSATLDSDLPADTLTVTDGTNEFFSGTGANPTTSGNGMPTSFAVTSIVPGTWNAALTATIEGSNDNFATSTVIATGVASGAAAIAVGVPYRSVRWIFGGPSDSVPGNFAATGMRVIGTLGSPAPSSAFGLYTNTSTMTVTRGPTTLTDSDSDQYILESPQPHPQINKDVNAPTRQPGQLATYTINVVNSPDATGSLANPFVEDCIPDYLTLQGAATLGTGWTAGTPLPTCAAGQTPQRFNYTGTLAPGQSTTNVTYVVQVDAQTPGPIAPPGTYTNTATVRPAGGGSFNHCVNTSPSCADQATVQVEPVVELNSQKCVTGDLDEGIFRPSPGCTPGSPSVVSAQTRPGGLMAWELRLTNTGNTDATNVDFIDLFPKVGDTSVITETANPNDGNALNLRNSEFAPYLVAPISAPPGWTVSYSTSANPCRSEVGRNVSCETPNWVTSPPFSAMPTFQSVKFHFSGVLPMGGSATFSWTTRAPVTDTTYDRGGSSSIDPYEFLLTCTAQTPRTDPTHCPRAVNSFAYGADAANLPVGVPQPSRLYAEPPAVEIRVTAPPKPNAIGNRVWLDRNNDGLQAVDTTSAGEPGIANVLVELYRLDTDLSTVGSPVYTFYGYTFTDAQGNYLFSSDPNDPASGLPDGSYKVRFVPPGQYYVSPGDQSGVTADVGAPGGGGSNTDNDSDVSRTPSTALTLTPATPAGPSNGGALGAFHDTVDVILGDNNNINVGTASEGEIDLTWDLGLWLPAPAIDVVKVTKDSAWPDSQAGDGVTLLQGRPVTWIYTVTNTGNTRLQNVTLTDNGGPNPSFSVSDCTILNNGTNADGLNSSAAAPIALNRNATMSCTATGTAQTTNYSNIITAVGTPTLDTGAPITRGSVPSTVTDTDPSNYVSGKYDLALAKTAGTIDFATGNVVYTITVRNEGTVGSGTFDVTDILPSGIAYVPGTATPALTSNTAGTLTWNALPNLAPSTITTITFTAHIDDYLARPYRNYAEISADSSSQVQTGGVPTPTTDADSTPDTNIANDNTGNGVAAGNGYGPVGNPDPSVDNATITEAGSRAVPNAGDDANDGQDDADIADLNPSLTYDLALAKIASNSPVALGSAPTFQVRVYNQGTVPSGQVTVVDQIPTGLTFTPTGSTSGCATGTGNQVTCTLSSINPGQSTLLTLATTINGTPDNYSTAPWRNWAEIASDSAQTLYGLNDIDSQPENSELDGVGANNALPGDDYVGVTTAATTYATPTGSDEDDNDDAVATTSVVFDLALTKTANATLVTQVSTITYTLTVQNQGTVDSGSYVITDTVPAGLGFASSADGGVLSPGTPDLVTFTMPNLAASATTAVTWTANVTDVTLRPYRNVAEISDDSATELYGITDVDSTPDTDVANDGNYGPRGTPSDIDGTSIADAGTRGGDPQDDADIADVDLQALRYDLALAKTVASPTVAADGLISYTITIQNQGNLDSQQVTVTDWIPSGLTVVNAGGGSTAVDGTISWAIANIPAGETITRTFTATVNDIRLRPYRNIAEITEDGADFYDISVPGNIVDVEDADSTPDTDRTNDGTYGPVMNPGAIDNVGSNAVGSAGLGSDPSDDADIADVDVPVTYDLALVKTGPASISPLGTATFTVTVRNQGNVPSGPFDVIDWVPAGMEAIAASNGGSLAAPRTQVTWTALASLNPGASLSLTVNMRIVDLTRRPFVNTSEITADSADLYDVAALPDTPGRPATPAVDVEDADSAPDAVINNDTLIDQTVIPADQFNDPDVDQDDHDIAALTTDVVYDLALIKTVDSSTIAYDGTATFTVTIANQGNVPSGSFTVVDTLPAGTAYVASSDGGVTSNGDTVVTWVLASIEPGASKSVTVSVRPVDLTKRPFRNVADITVDSASTYNTDTQTVTDADSVPSDTATSDADNTQLSDAGTGSDSGFDDEDVAVFDVPVVYDLALVKLIAAGQTYKLGLPITYTIQVKNQGNVPSGVYSVQDVVPTGMSFVSASDGGAVVAGVVLWNGLPSLAPGEIKSLTLQLRLDDLTQSSYRNIAEITSDSSTTYSTPTTPVMDKDSTPDPDPNNDPTVDNDDVNRDSVPGDEDDHDIATLDVTKITIDNRTPTVKLPTTGGTVLATLLIAAGLVCGGVLLAARRRRPAV